jgi:hypothetical protein
MATGTIGASATGTYSDVYDSGGQDGIAARGFGTISDGLHFAVAGAGSATVTDIGVTFTVDGSISHGSQTGPYQTVGSHLGFGGATFSSTASVSYGTDSFTDSAANWVSYGYSSNTADDIVFTGIYALTGASTDLGIDESLDASCGGGVDCNFSHTGAVSLSLPAGVSFTSDSGVFLTASPVAAVPEADSLAIFSVGLLALTATYRRRRASANL